MTVRVFLYQRPPACAQDLKELFRALRRGGLEVGAHHRGSGVLFRGPQGPRRSKLLPCSRSRLGRKVRHLSMAPPPRYPKILHDLRRREYVMSRFDFGPGLALGSAQYGSRGTVVNCSLCWALFRGWDLFRVCPRSPASCRQPKSRQCRAGSGAGAVGLQAAKGDFSLEQTKR